jgi:hypothetical protein
MKWKIQELMGVWLQGALLCAASSLGAVSSAQAPPQPWHAQWIAAAEGPARDYDVVYFRKQLTLPSVPELFMVDVSADTRFELHVNGKRVNAGPALADVHHWRYETYDLAPYLAAGQNEIAAIVWNYGTAAAIAQMSSQTAFLLSAEDPTNKEIDTGSGWQTSHERGRTLAISHKSDYYAAGPDEVMDGTKINWEWDRTSADDASVWLPAKLLGNAAPRGAQDSPTRWILQKDDLPSMQYTPVTAGHIVRVTGATSQLAGSLERPVTIPAHSDVTLLLDRGELTTAYPSLEISGGDQGTVDVTYAEALYDDHGQKGNRNEVAGRHIAGVEDHILSDGQQRTYRPLWWRTWRYIQVEVKTADYDPSS